MSEIRSYEQFPVGMVAGVVGFSLVVYLVGAYLLWPFGWFVAAAYLVYAAVMELTVLSRSCRSCYYYGKRCAFGKGSVCGTLFSKGNPSSFTSKPITFATLLPDFLVGILPIAGGLIGLVLWFSWTGVLVLLAFGLLFFLGTAMVRGRVACKYCRQRTLGCPAQQLFEKRQKKTPS